MLTVFGHNVCICMCVCVKKMIGKRALQHKTAAKIKYILTFSDGWFWAHTQRFHKSVALLALYFSTFLKCKKEEKKTIFYLSLVSNIAERWRQLLDMTCSISKPTITQLPVKCIYDTTTDRKERDVLALRVCVYILNVTLFINRHNH